MKIKNLKVLIVVSIIIMVATISSCLFERTRSNKTFIVTVDYNLSFDQMIKIGKYDSIIDIFESDFPIPHDKLGIKKFRASKIFFEICKKPLDSLSPEEIDSLRLVMDSLNFEKLREFVRKYGQISQNSFLHKKFNSRGEFEYKSYTSHYKKPSKEILTMKLFKNPEEMKEAGYRSATAHELMFFGKEYPDVQRKFNVFALGSICRKYVGTAENHWGEIFRVHGEAALILAGDDSYRKIAIHEMTEPSYHTYQKSEDVKSNKNVNSQNPIRFLGVILKQ